MRESQICRYARAVAGVTLPEQAARDKAGVRRRLAKQRGAEEQWRAREATRVARRTLERAEHLHMLTHSVSAATLKKKFVSLDEMEGTPVVLPPPSEAVTDSDSDDIEVAAGDTVAVGSSPPSREAGGDGGAGTDAGAAGDAGATVARRDPHGTPAGKDGSDDDDSVSRPPSPPAPRARRALAAEAALRNAECLLCRMGFTSPHVMQLHVAGRRHAARERAGAVLATFWRARVLFRAGKLRRLGTEPRAMTVPQLRGAAAAIGYRGPRDRAALESALVAVMQKRRVRSGRAAVAAAEGGAAPRRARQARGNEAALLLPPPRKRKVFVLWNKTRVPKPKWMAAQLSIAGAPLPLGEEFEFVWPERGYHTMRFAWRPVVVCVLYVDVFLCVFVCVCVRVVRMCDIASVFVCDTGCVCL